MKYECLNKMTYAQAHAQTLSRFFCLFALSCKLYRATHLKISVGHTEKNS